MKRIVFFLAIVPCLAFGLETVNLLKDASFEKNSELWQTSAGSVWATDNKKDSAVASRHDSLSATKGSFSASGDTRIKPGWNLDSGYDSAKVVFTGLLNKKVSDLDSLIWDQKMLFRLYDPNLNEMCYVAGFYFNAGKDNWSEFGYFFLTDIYSFFNFDRWKNIFYRTPDDTSWKHFARDLKNDLVDAEKYPPQTSVDSFLLISWGFWATPSVWYGQKVYWDNIRLMGYADYDVGVKELLSPDSIGSSESSGESLRNSPGAGYTPTARIKNFGRKAADSFLVIATIEGGSGVVYADTLSWSLTADTEDTVSFKEFKPSDAANYTLTVSTFMTPDESDEDDAMSKTLYGSGITETPSPSSLQLEVVALSSICFSLPLGEQGTISLYDPSGRRVESKKVTGSGEVRFNAGLASGVYFVKLENGKSSITKKTVVLR